MLPAYYRQEWEEDMVAAFLESMDSDDPETNEYNADHGRPSLAEIASVVCMPYGCVVVGTQPARRGRPRLPVW